MKLHRKQAMSATAEFRIRPAGLARVLAFVACVGMVGLVSTNAMSLPGDAGINVFSVITVTNRQDLDFGKIVAPSSGQLTFKVNPLGAMNDDGDVALGDTLPSDGYSILNSGYHNGIFYMTGEPGVRFQVSTAYDQPCNESDLLLVVSLSNVPLGGGEVKFSDAGDLTINVGGDLRVIAGVPPGAYTCSYSVTANYY